MAKMKKKSKVFSIIIAIILLIIVIGAVSFFWYNTDGFKVAPRTLYITCDNNIIDGKAIEMEENQEYVFDIVDYTDLWGKSAIEYNVRIAPNLGAKEIKYRINDEEMLFTSTPDYSAAFELTKNPRGFTIKQPDEWNIAKMLSKVNDGAEIELLEPIEPGVYFCAEVTIGKKQIRFDLAAKLTSIGFDNEEIIL